jgi:hypothetical protein
MKIKPLAFLSLLFISTLISCKKESEPGIVGEWVSEAFYLPGSNGVYSWTVVPDYTESLTLTESQRFSYFTDVQGGSGTYFYQRAARQLELKFEADSFGSPAINSQLQVVEVTEENLVVASVNAPDHKIRYVRRK